MKRILIVEDQQDSLLVMQAGLQNLSADYEVTEVGSAEDGLHALKKGPFDLLIADVLLPGISGLELMAHFRHYSPDTKVILISGAPDSAMRDEVAKAGAEAFFFKPLDLSDLLDAVERVLAIDKAGTPIAVLLQKADIENAAQKGNQIAKEISDLRAELKAETVLLVSERGQVMARSGALPDDSITSSLMPDLMVSFFASLRVASFMQSRQPDNLLCFRGENYHLHLISLSPSYLLLIVTQPQNSDRLSRLADSSQLAVAKLGQMLTEFELPYEPGMHLFKAADLSTKDAEGEDFDPDLEGLLHAAETKPMSHRKAEKYWKSASREILVHPARGGALTYEQARRLGLTPSDNH